MPEDSPPPPALPPELEARFELLEVLGQGQFGVVVKARDRSLDRLVAIKRIRSGTPPGSSVRERFLREAQLMSRIESPHVARLYDFGICGREPYMVAEYLAGRDLGAALAERPPLDCPRAASFLRQLLEGLAAAHEAGVVHRDVKPANILLRGEDQLVLTDFGLGRGSEDITLTASGAVLGTPAYMAPEQMEGLPIDPAWDVYAAGVIWWVMLTGKVPMIARTLPNTYLMRREGPRAGPQTPGGPLDAALEAFSLRMLAGQGARRPADARAALRELEEALAGPAAAAAPEPAGPPPPVAPGEASRAFPRPDPAAPRRSWFLPGVAGLALGLVGGLALGLDAWRRRGPDRPPGEVAAPAAPDPVEELVGFLAAVEGSPAIRDCLNLTSRARPDEAASRWVAARAAWSRLVEAHRVPAQVAALEVRGPEPTVLELVGQLQLRQHLLATTTRPQLAGRHPAGEVLVPGLGSYLDRFVTVRAFSPLSGVVAKLWRRRRDAYRPRMEEGGRTWAPLRSFEDLRTGVGTNWQVRLQNPAGDLFEDPTIDPATGLGVSFQSVRAVEFLRQAPARVELRLRPFQGDLVLVGAFWPFPPSAVAWLQLEGSSGSLGFPFRPLEIPNPTGAALDDLRGGVSLRVAAAVLPRDTERATLRFLGLHPLGSPIPSVSLDEVYQLVGGELDAVVR